MNNYSKDGGSSGNGTTIFNFNPDVVFPFQVVTIINSSSWSNRDTMRKNMETLNKKYPRDNRGTIHGSIRSGVHPEGTHYFVSGYLTYRDLLESDRDFRISNPEYMKDRNKAVKLLNIYKDIIIKAKSMDLRVNAGHDLNLKNLPPLRALNLVDEVSIGHAVIVDSLKYGFIDTIKRYVDITKG